MSVFIASHLYKGFWLKHVDDSQIQGEELLLCVGHYHPENADFRPPDRAKIGRPSLRVPRGAQVPSAEHTPCSRQSAKATGKVYTELDEKNVLDYYLKDAEMTPNPTSRAIICNAFCAPPRLAGSAAPFGLARLVQTSPIKS